MTMHLGDVPAGITLYIPLASYSGSTGASITLTGLAVTDIEIYKNGSVTQRASDNGYTLLDTDGIDFDGTTGIHGFSVDLADNSDASFFAVGSFYWVIVSAVTIDGQTVNLIAATFRIVAAEAVAGKPKVDVDAWLGTAAATPTVNGVPEVDVTHFGGSAATASSGRPEVNASHISGDSVAADNLEAAYDDTDGPVPRFGIVDQGTAQSASATGVVLRAAAAFADDVLIGTIIGVHGSTQGYWQFRQITDNALSGDSVVVDTWTVTPSGTITYKIFGAVPAPTTAPSVSVTHWSGTAVASPHTAGYPVVTIKDGTGTGEINTLAGAIVQTTIVNSLAAGAIDAAAIADGAITAAKIATGAIDADAIADGAIDAGAIASDAITAAKIAAGAITSAKFAAGAIDATAIAADAIDADAIATDAFGALELAAGAASEIGTAVRTELATELARIDTTISSRASQTTLDTLDDLVDTEVAAIKTKTDQLTFTTANKVDSRVDNVAGTAQTAGDLAAQLAILVAADRVYPKNVAVTGFMFPMQTTAGAAATGKTVTATISKDTGAFAAVAGSVSELSGGWYYVNYTQTEFNADEIALNYTASGCRPTQIKIRTQS